MSWFPAIGKGKYLADPFGIVRGGVPYVLCEEFDYASHRGRIVCFRVADHDGMTSRKTVIEEAFHLSYPYLLEWRGRIYCVPETQQAQEITLYEENSFPDTWTRSGALVPNFAGVDPTLFPHEGRWWLACGNEHARPNSALFLWYAGDPRGPWSPHPRNPVKVGRNGTRPAGTPFAHQGQLYRPAMDSSRTYGQRIVINRVRKLTPTEFEEEPAKVLEPFPDGRYPDGVHTLSRLGEWTLVDGMRVVFERTEFERTLQGEKRAWLGRLSPLLNK